MREITNLSPTNLPERHEAIGRLLDRLERPDEPAPLVVTTTGMISREAHRHRDRPEHFYLVGSMGLASTVGLGLALTRPDRRVVVLDGDGSALMALGHLAMVAEQAPKNLLHVVLDNRAYASTGGQRSISDRVPLDRLAEAAGYARVARLGEVGAEEAGADDGADFDGALDELLSADGPAFLLVRVASGNLAGIGRVEVEPPELARRFRSAVAGENKGKSRAEIAGNGAGKSTEARR